jgi:hypothetical protein
MNKRKKETIEFKKIFLSLNEGVIIYNQRVPLNSIRTSQLKFAT